MEIIKNIFLKLKCEFLKDAYPLILSILFFLFLFLYWGRFGNPIIDCGREAYIPYAMADLGKVLFKDIICIYGPVPYYLNALFVKFFGASLNTFYLIGGFLSYIFLVGIYSLAKRFINAHSAFIYSMIILFVCILNPSISNFIFPYSYAIVYALIFALFHLIFMFKYVDILVLKSVSDVKYLCISAVFLALCLLSKLDFLPCILPFLIILFKYRKTLNLKDFIKISLCFLIPFLIILIIFFVQNVSLQNLIFNFKMISNMAHSPSLNYFYTVCTGYFFDFKKTFMFVPQFLFITLIFLITGAAGFFAGRIKNRPLCIALISFVVLVNVVLFLGFSLTRYIFVYIPLLIVLFLAVKGFIFAVKKIKNLSLAVFDTDILIYLFIVFSILFSLKTIFGLFHELYGVYYLPFILLSFIVIIFQICTSSFKQVINKALTPVFISVILLFAFQNCLIFLGVKNVPVKAKKDILYSEAGYAENINEAVDFLEKKLKSGDTVLSLPEGLIFNFILKNEYKFFNTSFTPLDFDAYGEDYLIRNLLANEPKYIIMYLRSYEDYGKGYLCEDFGQEFCKVIKENYTDDILHDKNTPPPLEPYVVRIFERKNDD